MDKPVCNLAKSVKDQSKQHQWRAYIASLEISGVLLETATDEIWQLVGPSYTRIIAAGHKPSREASQ